MFCKKCGSEIRYDGKFCPKCGTQVNHSVNYNENTEYDEDSSTILLHNRRIEPNHSYQEQQIPFGYQPIGMWGYFGYSILFNIPIIGIIIALIIAFGGSSNINLKNYARAQFCVLIIQVVLFFLLFSILGSMVRF